MKRSGSKLISRASSVKNVAKAGYRFAFELVLQSCDTVLGNSDVVCTWERGPKLLATEPFKIHKGKRLVVFDGATLRQEITLFKKRKSDPDFEPKVFRVALRQGSAEGKIVGKIGIDFAGYAQLPSSSKKISAQLSSGSRLILTVNSTYMGEVRRKRERKSAAGASSTGSDASDSTLFSDLTIDDSLSSVSSAPTSPGQGFDGNEDGNGSGPLPVLHLQETGKERDEIRRLKEENRELRRDVAELQERFAREPEYADVVRQLREAKVALAILSVERDELQQRVRQRKA